MKSTAFAPITATGIEAWLREMGCTPSVLPPEDPQAQWQIQFPYPPGVPSSHHLVIVGPKNRPRALVVLTQIQLSTEHLAVYPTLEDSEKQDFLRDLVSALNREFVEYALFPGQTPLDCPQGFQVNATRFDDGLTLDSFARTVSSVYKAELAAIECVRRHLTPRGAGGAGHFDFRRMGGAIQ